jgi:hypothetical protein
LTRVDFIRKRNARRRIEASFDNHVGTTLTKTLALLAQIRSGGAVVNDIMVGENQTDMPFGGVGTSGIPTPES